MYNDVYFQNDQMFEASKRYFQATALQRRFESRFQDPTANAPAAADSLQPMGPDDLKQYSILLTDSLDTLRDCRFLADIANSFANAVLRGARSADEVEDSVARDHHFTNIPGTTSKPAAR